MVQYRMCDLCVYTYSKVPCNHCLIFVYYSVEGENCAAQCVRFFVVQMAAILGSTVSANIFFLMG